MSRTTGCQLGYGEVVPDYRLCSTLLMIFVDLPGSLGSLYDFTRPTHTSTAISLLPDEPFARTPVVQLGAILPPSLTSLSLWIDPDWDDARWERIVVQLLESKRETVPLLKTLSVGGSYHCAEEVVVVQRACAQAEMELASLRGHRPQRPPPPQDRFHVGIPLATTTEHASSISRVRIRIHLSPPQLVTFDRDFRQRFNKRP